jgi:hypothetical protein
VELVVVPWRFGRQMPNGFFDFFWNILLASNDHPYATHKVSSPTTKRWPTSIATSRQCSSVVRVSALGTPWCYRFSGKKTYLIDQACFNGSVWRIGAPESPPGRWPRCNENVRLTKNRSAGVKMASGRI